MVKIKSESKIIENEFLKVELYELSNMNIFQFLKWKRKYKKNETLRTTSTIRTN